MLRNYPQIKRSRLRTRRRPAYSLGKAIDIFSDSNSSSESDSDSSSNKRKSATLELDNQKSKQKIFKRLRKNNEKEIEEDVDIFSESNSLSDSEPDSLQRKRKVSTLKNTKQLFKTRSFKRLRKIDETISKDDMEIFSETDDTSLEFEQPANQNTTPNLENDKGKEKKASSETITLCNDRNLTYKFEVTSYYEKGGNIISSYENNDLNYCKSFHTKEEFLVHIKNNYGLSEEKIKKINNPIIKNILPHQQNALDNIKKYFDSKDNERASIVMACAAGKTFTGLKAIEELGVKLVLIAVPALALIRQVKKEYQQNMSVPFDYICVCSDTTVDKDKSKILSNVDKIRQFLVSDEENQNLRIVFSTYQSLKKIHMACAATTGNQSTMFDLVLCDEAHHVIEKNNFNYFKDKIPTKKWLFMTATLPGENILDKEIPKDCTGIFGRTIYSLSCRDAIDERIISDFRVVLAGVRDPEFHKKISYTIATTYHKKGDVQIEETTRAAASHMALTKVTYDLNLKYTFAFHSRVQSSHRFAKTHDLFLPDDENNLYSDHIDGSMKAKYRSESLKQFKLSETGLISSAKALSEGINVPAADAVIFVDPCSSPLKIIQSVGRALRKNGQSEKLTHIIIPVHYRNDEDIYLGKYKKLIRTLVALYLGENLTLKKSSEKKATEASCIDDQARGESKEIEFSDMIRIEGFPEEIKDLLYSKLYDLIPDDKKNPDDSEFSNIENERFSSQISNYKKIVKNAKQNKLRKYSYYSENDDLEKSAYSDYLFLWKNKDKLPAKYLPLLHEFHRATKNDHKIGDDSKDGVEIYQLDSFIYYHGRLPEFEEKFCNLNFYKVFILRCKFYNNYWSEYSENYLFLKKHESLLALNKSDIKKIIFNIDSLTTIEKELLSITFAKMYNSRTDLTKYTFALLKKLKKYSFIRDAYSYWGSNYKSANLYIQKHRCLASEYSKEGKWIREQQKYFDNLEKDEKKKIELLRKFLIEQLKQSSKKELEGKREARKALQTKRFCFFRIADPEDRKVLSALKNFDYLDDGNTYPDVANSIVVGPAPKLPFNGYGAFAIVDIPAGTKLGQYTGYYILSSNYDGKDDFYFWNLSDGTTISAMKSGNWTRFANHSKRANTYADEILHNSRRIIELTAARTIYKGQPILLDYGSDYWKKMSYSSIELTQDDGIDCNSIRFCH